MEQKREIQAKEFIQDLRSGSSREDLMKKYKLSSVGFQSVLRKLVKARLLSKDEVRGRGWSYKAASSEDELRKYSRTEVKFPLVVCPADNPQQKGFVRDISPHGLSVEGVNASVGESTKLRVRSNELADSGTFEFQVKCKWIEENESDDEKIAGFEITSISTGAFKELEKIRER